MRNFSEHSIISSEISLMNATIYLMLCCGLLCSPVVQAQNMLIGDLLELSLEKLMEVRITTISKAEEALNRSPGVMTVITAKEIAQFGANSLYEVLERATSVYTPGAYVSAQNQISLRGDLSTIYDNHVLLLINGRPFRDGTTGGNNFPIYTAFPVGIIERVEIVRGPGSVLYGSNAYVGVINIITKSETNTRIAVKAGSFHAKATEASTMLDLDGLKLVAGMKTFKEDGWLLEAKDEAGKSGSTLFGEDNIGAYVNAQYRNVTLSTFIAKSTGNRWGTVPVWEGREKWNKMDRALIDLGYEHKFSDTWRTQLNATLNYVSMVSDYTKSDTLEFYSNDTLVEMTHFVDSGKWKWLFGGVANIMSGHVNQYDSNHKLLSALISENRKTWYSGYVQGDYQLLDTLRLVLGGQVIKAEQVDSKWVPRLGVVYQFSPNTGMKALYGQAYRSAFQLETTVNAANIKGNPSLAPETVATLDLQLFHNTKDYQLSATYFQSKQENLITRIPPTNPAVSPQDIYVNRGEINFKGLELQSQFVPTSRLLINASLTYQTNESEGKEDFSMVPNWMGKLGISYEFDKGSSIGLFNNWFSDGHDVAMKYSATKHINPEPKAYNLMTLNLNLNLKRWISLPITLDTYVYNVLDEDIYAPEFGRSRINSLPAKQGRGIYVGFQYKFD